MQVKRGRPDGLLIESDILQQRKTDAAFRKVRGLIVLARAFVSHELPFTRRRVLRWQPHRNHRKNEQTAKEICYEFAHLPRFIAQNLAAIAADVPIEEIVVAVCIRVFHFGFCPVAFSGTTTMSPGRRAALNALPVNNPSVFLTLIDPSARITKMEPLSAS